MVRKDYVNKQRRAAKPASFNIIKDNEYENKEALK
jgi:hypothetical protein